MINNYALKFISLKLNLFCSLMSRQVEELLWLLMRVDLKEELYYAVLNVDTLIYLFAR